MANRLGVVATLRIDGSHRHGPPASRSVSGHGSDLVRRRVPPGLRTAFEPAGAFGSPVLPLAFRLRVGLRRCRLDARHGGFRLRWTGGRASRSVWAGCGGRGFAQTGVSSVASTRIMRWIIAGRSDRWPDRGVVLIKPAIGGGRCVQSRLGRSRSASSQEGQTSEPTGHESDPDVPEVRPVCGEE